MNPRKILVFFKTPTGKLLGFLVLVGLGLAFAGTGLKSCRRDAGELTTRIAKVDRRFRPGQDHGTHGAI